MNSTSWVEDQQKLTDWSFATFQLRDVTRGQLITKIPVSLGDLESFSAVVQASDQLPASKDYSWQIDWNSDSFRAPVLRGGKIGVGYLKSGGQKLGPFPVVSLQNVRLVPPNPQSGRSQSAGVCLGPWEQQCMCVGVASDSGQRTVPEERLHKFLARCGITSRRKAELLISEGRVTVNGDVIEELGTKVSEEDDVRVDSRPVRLLSWPMSL